MSIAKDVPLDEFTIGHEKTHAILYLLLIVKYITMLFHIDYKSPSPSSHHLEKHH
jgi:hypothetical protein